MNPRPTPRTLVSLALGSALVLALGRIAILLLLEHKLRDMPLDDALWRITHDVQRLALHALVAGAGLALLASLRARVGGFAIGLVALLLGASLCLSVLSGVPVDDPYQTPHPSTDRGRYALFGLIGIALLTTAVAQLAARRWRLLDARRAPAVLAALFVAPLLLAWIAYGRVAPERRVRQIVQETAFEPDLWQVTRSHPRQAPELTVITPSPYVWRDGGDRPGIMMPPPCELSFVAPQVEGELRLHLSAGVDQLAYRRRMKDAPAITVAFEVLVDGESRFTHETLIERFVPKETRVWVPVGGPRGLEVEPGARVTLRTEILSPEWNNPNKVPVVAAGFGDVVFDSTLELRRERSSEEAPNLVLVVMDTLRQDSLSSYGAPPGSTPNLDALAARGMLFENAYSTSSWTWPSTASILTGLYPESHGVEADGSCYLRASFDTLPELLEGRGYTTAAFTCNPLIVAEHGFSQGFEDFDALARFRFSPTMIDRPLDWLEMNADSRFFLYVHLVDAHWPYAFSDEVRAELDAIRPADYPERGVSEWHTRLVLGEGRDENGELLSDAVPPEHLEYMRAEYEAAVRASDRWVGRLLTKLSELGLDERTIVAFTSDHGEEFLEHGLATHGNQLYPEVVRIPLMLAGPGVPAGQRVATRVSNRHVAPTLARFGNAPFPALPDAQDLVRAAGLEQRPIFTSTHQGWWNGKHRVEIFAVNDGEWSLQWSPRGAAWNELPEPGGAGAWRLYHVAEDPLETRDLAQAEPEKAAELLAILQAHLKEASEQRPVLTVGIGQAGRDLLADIGYTATEDDEEDEDDEEQSEDGAEGDSPHR